MRNYLFLVLFVKGQRISGMKSVNGKSVITVERLVCSCVAVSLVEVLKLRNKISKMNLKHLVFSIWKEI